MIKSDQDRLDTFLHKCLRRILRVYWPVKVTNEEIRERASINCISEQVRRRRWKWLGYVL